MRVVQSQQPASPSVQFSPGEAIELDADHVWELVRGEVIVSCAGRPVDLWRAPMALGTSNVVREDHTAAFFAATDVEIVGRSLDQLSPGDLASRLAEENAALWRRVEADARRDDDTFLEWAMPVPGPWHFRRADAIAMVVQGDPERIAACLPRGVRALPGSGGRYILALTRFEGVGSLDVRDSSQFTYHEVTPFLPVWSGWRGPGAFVPELYPDAWMAVLLGREIHGFPKRTARIGFDDDGGHLIVDRRLALRVRYSESTNIDDTTAISEIAAAITGSELARKASHKALALLSDDVEMRFSALVHKRIGSPESAGNRLAIDDLVRVPVHMDPIRSAERLGGLDIDLPGGPGILHGDVLSAWRLQSGFRFGRGRVERKRVSR